MKPQNFAADRTAKIATAIGFSIILAAIITGMTIIEYVQEQKAEEQSAHEREQTLNGLTDPMRRARLESGFKKV